MEIFVQAHQAVVSDALRARAERAARTLAARLDRPVDATVRFEPDGVAHRVEIVLHAPRRRSLVATATDKQPTAALAEAARRLEAQIHRLKRPAARRRGDRNPPA